MKRPNISIAIAVHNEQEVLPELFSRVLAVLSQIPGGPHELIFVDDGSTDGTLGILREAADRDARICVVSLSRNFGHQAALTAALDYVNGDAVALMDGDLQDAPEHIFEFLQKFEEGYDVVYATRASRKEPLWLKFCYRAFYRIQNALSDTRLPLDAGDFGLMSGRVVRELRRLPERQRYLRGLRSWVGYRQIGIPIHRDERHSGTSKYSVARLIRLASDGIFAFSTLPLRVASLAGAIAIVASLMYGIASVIGKFVYHRVPQGFTALVLLMTFLVGVVLFSLGIVGEYVGRIYEEVKGRPMYVVDHVYGFAQTSAGEVARTARERAPGEISK